jgi:hypothetical protein
MEQQLTGAKTDDKKQLEKLENFKKVYQAIAEGLSKENLLDEFRKLDPEALSNKRGQHRQSNP